MEFIKRIFKDYLQGSANPSETAMADTWYLQTGEQATPEWITEKHLREVKAEILQGLSEQLNFEENKTPPGKPLKLLYIKRYLPYAAALVLIVSGWMILRRLTEPQAKTQKLSDRQVFSTAVGVRKKLVLPDGTTVWLNNGTRLSLSMADYRNAGTREVWLDEGEAYFEVTKNPAKPFIVHIDSLQARVLGTAFNIQAYRQLATMQVLVTHGCVQVSAASDILDTLMRNRQLTFYGKGRFFVTQKTDEQTPAWWNNRFVLNKASFKELALRLQLRFGVQLSSNNQRILQTSFSAGFPENTSLENVLAVLCTIYKTSYRRIDNSIIIQ